MGLHGDAHGDAGRDDGNGGGDGDIDNTATADSDQSVPDSDDATVPVDQNPR